MREQVCPALPRVAGLEWGRVLGVYVPGSNRLFRLLGYNGKSHEHSITIEGETFYDFHIHRATERYQELGTREDAYAEVTDRYGDFHGALMCLNEDANVKVARDPQMGLFEGAS